MILSRQSSTVRSSNREIRLLDLLPGKKDDHIRCATRVVSLDQHPDFETVSYVWGDRKGESAIEVSGQSILITKNLYTGLLRLRSAVERRTLWIDQICINQWDLEEKAAQVALMRDIYRQCTRCVTWMGELTRDGHEVPIRDAEAVFHFLRQVAAAKIAPLSDMPVLFEQSKRGSAARKAFEAFSMYGNPWWSRIWTVQEAIIPSSGILMWGPLSISRKEVLTAALNLRDLSKIPSLPERFTFYRHTYTELLRRLLYPVHGFNHSKTDNALNLLMRWRHREFTDPRDKVYALLGMITPSALPSAQSCDYTISVARLFAQVTLDLINHEGSLRPLLGACEMMQQSADIASWAIDFACVNRIGKRQLRWWGHSHRYRVFSAWGENSLALPHTVDKQVLGLQGVLVDEVIGTVELLRISAQDSVELDELKEPLMKCYELIKRFRTVEAAPSRYIDGFTWESAFCRTLVGDLIMDELPVNRIASYGRARLEADFEELFDKLQISLDSKLQLDFAARLDSYSPACSPTSPTSPTYSGAGSTYSPSLSAHPETLATYSPPSPVYTGTTFMEGIPDSQDQAARSPGVNDQSHEPVIPVRKVLKRLDSNESLEWDQDVSQNHPTSPNSTGRRTSVNFLESAKDVPYPEEPGSPLPPNPLNNNSPEALFVDTSIPNPHPQPPRSPQSSSASSTSRFSAYSETHWTPLPTDLNPYLTPSEDSLRTSRIRRLRDEFLSNSRTLPDNSHRSASGAFTNLHESLIGMMENQTFFITKSGYIGIGPEATRRGDQVWVFDGGNVPFVMRGLCGDKEGCKRLGLVGDAYVHGVMDGEAVDGSPVVRIVNVH